MAPNDCVEPLCTLDLWEEPEFLILFLKSVDLGFVPQLAYNFRKFSHDNRLTRLLLEYYNVEDNCFIFNNNRLYIGLVDVFIGTGLRVHGKPVVCNAVKNWRNLCETSFGELPDEAFETKHGVPKPKLSLIWLRTHFKNLLTAEGGDLEVGTESWKRYIKAYWLYFIGCYIAPDSSKGLVSIEYLGLLDNIEDIGQYAWGAASLTRLIHGLKNKKVNTLAAFLMVFFLEFIPPLRQKLLNLDLQPRNQPTHVPLLLQWGDILSNVFKRTVHMKNIVSDCRQLLDSLTAVDNPYCRLDLQEYKNHLVTACRDTICHHMSDVQEHQPSKFYMQYGYRTLVPSTIELPLAEQLYKKKGPKADRNIFNDEKFKRFLDAWEKICPLKGELLDRWSAEKAPWLVEELVDTDSRPFRSLDAEITPVARRLFTGEAAESPFTDEATKSQKMTVGSSVHASPDGSKTLSQAHGKGGEDYESEIKTPASSSQSLHTIDTRVQDCTGVRCKNAIPVELLLKNNTDRSPLKKKGKKK